MSRPGSTDFRLPTSDFRSPTFPLDSNALAASLLALRRRHTVMILAATVTQPDDVEDVLADLACRALSGLDRFTRRGDLETRAWLDTLCRTAIASHVRATRRRHRLSPISLESLSAWDQLWALLATDDARTALLDAELRAEARTRLRYAGLPAVQRDMLQRHLDGEKLASIGRSYGCSGRTVSRNLREAIAALRAVDLESMESPDIDQARIRAAALGGYSIYRPPSPKTGAGLARLTPRERLRLQWDDWEPGDYEEWTDQGD